MEYRDVKQNNILLFLPQPDLRRGCCYNNYLIKLLYNQKTDYLICSYVFPRRSKWRPDTAAPALLLLLVLLVLHFCFLSLLSTFVFSFSLALFWVKCLTAMHACDLIHSPVAPP